ncbi:DUF6152 family protein [uncultured Enterovirga sp.]|uniref:DUF6152 family protein n=1 Tax=uncultured Enterovirga sp. TaxID=2026352 RepID=UPI0035CAD9B8
MRSSFILGAFAAGALVLGGTALAHHGWGEYDSGKTLVLSGPVETVSPGNPHVSVTLKFEGKTWLAVLAPPTRMSSRGLPPETIKAGSDVKLEGYPKRTGDPEMRAERITMAGKTIELR